jgi:hypothetical protein
VSYLPKEIRKWVPTYPDSLTRVRLTALADKIEELEGGVDSRIQEALRVLETADLETDEALQADLADKVRAALIGHAWSDSTPVGSVGP